MVFLNLDLIEQHVLNFYQDLFLEQSVFDVDFRVVSEVIPFLVSVDDNAGLVAKPSVSEVNDAILDLDPLSALGSDGFNGMFYSSC